MKSVINFLDAPSALQMFYGSIWSHTELGILEFLWACSCFSGLVLHKTSSSVQIKRYIILVIPIGMYEGQLGHKGMDPKNHKLAFQPNSK